MHELVCLRFAVRIVIDCYDMLLLRLMLKDVAFLQFYLKERNASLLA